jgi:nucleolar protein 9
MNEEAAHPVALQGSLLLQACLNFNKPIKVIRDFNPSSIALKFKSYFQFVQSILALDSDTLVQILSDPKGCHVSDAFVTSKFVGEKSREKLFQCLKVETNASRELIFLT